MTTYNEKLIALENILGKSSKEIEQLKSEKIAFTDEERLSLIENLRANYSTAFIVKSLLRNNLPFYVSLLLSEEERTKEREKKKRKRKKERKGKEKEGRRRRRRRRGR